MATVPEDPSDKTDSRLTSPSPIAEPIAAPETEGKLFFDLDQGDLVDTSNREIFELCSSRSSQEQNMIPKNCSELVEEEPRMYQEEAVSPRSFYNSFPQVDLKQEWRKPGHQERSLEDMLRGQHQGYTLAWKQQNRNDNYPTIRQDVQIKQGQLKCITTSVKSDK